MADPLKISIVTPSYNSAETIERTIQSVLNQNYPNLEYIIVDGGSTDGTPEIIQKYANELHYWISEPDNGMYDALEKGFAQASGEILAWINSDDMHNPWTLSLINDVFQDLPKVEWITTLFPLMRNPRGDIVETIIIPGYHKDAFYRGEYSSVSSFVLEQIQQESTFWRRSLWEKVGNRMDKTLKLAGDFELWSRFFQYAELIGVRTSIGGIVNHANQMTKLNIEQRLEEERIVLNRYNNNIHTIPTAMIRRFCTGLSPRFKRLASRFGFAYQAQIAVYDYENERWKLKTRYF